MGFWGTDCRPGYFTNDVGHPDFLVQHRLQDDEASRGIVVEGYGLPITLVKVIFLMAFLMPLAVGALTVGDRLGDDADGVVAAPGLQVGSDLYLALIFSTNALF